MGLINYLRKKKAEREAELQEQYKRENGYDYDVNAPIETYSEKQIKARIVTELDKDALEQYENLEILPSNDKPIQYIDKSGYWSYHTLTTRYFLNDFFKKAVTRKAREFLHKNYTSAVGGTSAISLEKFEEDLIKIYVYIGSLAEEARTNEETKIKNAEEIKKINEFMELEKHAEKVLAKAKKDIEKLDEAFDDGDGTISQ